jgi:hypothetical protein
LTTTIADLSTTGSDVANTVSVSDGDAIHIRHSVVPFGPGTSPTAAYCTYGVVFVPDVADTFLIPYSGPQFLPAGSVTRYSHTCSGGDSWNGSTLLASSVTQQMTVRRCRGHVSNGAPAGQGWSFQTYAGEPGFSCHSGVTDDARTDYRHVNDWNNWTYQKVISTNVSDINPYNKTSASICLECVLGHAQTERDHTTGHLGIHV